MVQQYFYVIKIEESIEEQPDFFRYIKLVVIYLFMYLFF